MTAKQKLLAHIMTDHISQAHQSSVRSRWTLKELEGWHGNQHYRFSPNHRHEGHNSGPDDRPEGWKTGEDVITREQDRQAFLALMATS